MNTPESSNKLDLVSSGPMFRCQRRFRLIGPERELRVGRRIGTAVLITWVPIMVLALMQGQLVGHEDPLLRHFGVHTRCLIAIPLLILAEGLALTFIPLIVEQFVNSGLVRGEQIPEFRLAAEKSRRLLDSSIAFLAILGLAAFEAVKSIIQISQDHDTAWALTSESGGTLLGLAGWWFILVARPIFVILLANWIWRVVCLFIFFRSVSRLDLDLAPTHADKAGGLGFLEEGVIVFVPVVLALSAVLASNWAHNVLYHGLHVASLQPLVIAYLILVLAIFLSPWLAFMPTLKKFRRRSKLAYGALLTRYSQLVDRRWIRGEKLEEDDVLSAPELGPVADMASLFEGVEGIRTVPLRKRAAIQIILAALLPLVPVFAIEMPVKDILKQLLGALLM